MTEPTPAAYSRGIDAQNPTADAAPVVNAAAEAAAELRAGEPEPLGIVRTPTGNADVDAALDRLGDADSLDADGHLAVYEDAHRQMRDALEELDRRSGPLPPAPQGLSRP